MRTLSLWWLYVFYAIFASNKMLFGVLGEVKLYKLNLLVEKFDSQRNNKMKNFSHRLTAAFCNFVALVLALISFSYQSHVEVEIKIIANMDEKYFRFALLWCTESDFSKEISWTGFCISQRRVEAFFNIHGDVNCCRTCKPLSLC